MCYQCNYAHLLENSGLGSTPNRLKVLEVIGNNNYPLNPREIIDILSRSTDINCVTVYRILDLLVEKKLIDRISGGGVRFIMAWLRTSIISHTHISIAGNAAAWNVYFRKVCTWTLSH